MHGRNREVGVMEFRLKGTSWVCRGRHGGVGIVEFGYYQTLADLTLNGLHCPHRNNRVRQTLCRQRVETSTCAPQSCATNTRVRVNQSFVVRSHRQRPVCMYPVTADQPLHLMPANHEISARLLRRHSRH